MHIFNKIAKALSDENRLKMLKLLTEKDVCVCEMNEIFPMSHSQVSRSLNILYNAGFLKRWHEGKCVVYMADRVNDNIYCQKMLNLIADFFNDDESIQKLREKLQQVIKDKVRERSK
ncbi:ArsR/SmtB family transcription factor [Chloroflexota bacterium]